ncbi:EamA family transporter [Clostridium oryzae]|uniref:EamA family transporter n=1 Tax=Clostridium oryzae TaxID=1450648 RepID=UPI001FA8A531|nr:EamA family transporter [Clostridium oryzae]
MYICFSSSIGTTLYGVFNNTITLNFNFKAVVCYPGISIISTIVSIILLLKATKIIGVSSSAILGTFEPIVSIFLGVLFLGEKLSIVLLIGSIFILTSTIVLARDRYAHSN